MRKIIPVFIVVILLVSILFLLTKQKDTKEQKLLIPMDSDQIINWSVMLSASERSMNEAFTALADRYNKKKGGEYVRLQMFNTNDYSQNMTWMETKLFSGSTPDIMQTWHYWAQEYHKKGLVIDLMPYLKEGQDPVINNIIPELIKQNIYNEKLCPSVPLATVAVKVIYNKQKFKQAGIVKLPHTLPELFACSEKLQENNITPFIIPNSSLSDDVTNWINRMFIDQMIRPIIPFLDLDKSGLVDLNEIKTGISIGIINMEKEPWNHSIQLTKDFSRYWMKDYNNINRSNAIKMFSEGKGAMIIEWSFAYKSILDQVNGAFEIGTFAFPYITKEQSPYASETLHEMGGAPQLNMCIPYSVNKKKLANVIDFLRFLCSKEAGEVLRDVAGIKSSRMDVSPPSLLDGYDIVGKTSALRLTSPMFSKELYELDWRLGKLYLSGTISAEDYYSAMNKVLLEMLD